MVLKSKRFQSVSLSHFSALYTFALKLTGSIRDAEDLVQETYLRAYAKFDQFDFGTNCKTWMFKIMKNIFLDQLREKDPLLAKDMVELDEVSNLESLSNCSFLNSIDIKTAFENLPKKYQIPVFLKDVEGFSYGEISEILNLPIGTVMSRLFRGRKEMKLYFTAGKSAKIDKPPYPARAQRMMKIG